MMMIVFGLTMMVLGPLVVLTDNAALWPAGGQVVAVACCVAFGLACVLMGVAGRREAR